MGEEVGARKGLTGAPESRGATEGEYQERTSQVAARWRLVIIASSAGEIREGKKLPLAKMNACSSGTLLGITGPGKFYVGSMIERIGSHLNSIGIYVTLYTYLPPP